MTCCGEYMNARIDTSADQKTKTTTYTCSKCGKTKTETETIRVPRP